MLMVLLVASPLVAEGELVRAVESRRVFLDDVNEQKKRANWLKLVKEFEDAALAQVDPRHASRARYLGADISARSAKKFGQKKDLEVGEKLSRRSVRDCSRCTHSAAAQLLNGRLLLELKELDKAHKQLKKVELNYPGSPEVAVARKLLGQKTSTQQSQTQAQKSDATPPPPDRSPEVEPESTPPPPSRPPEITIPNPPSVRADGQAQIYFLTLEDFGNYTKVTAYVDKVVPYVYNLIPPAREGRAFRAYADLKGTVIAPGVKLSLPPSQKSTLVRLVKMNQFQKDVVRLVLDLPQAYPYRPTFISNPPRLVFQVAREATFLADPELEAQPDPVPPPAWSVTPPGAATVKASRGPDDSLARQLGLKIKNVVLDPGHGGKDGGATGYGLREKEIVLKLAKKLKVKLEKRLGLTVHLTRSDDRFLTLERRTKIAKAKKADIFLSLHVNANNLAKVEGFETYILNFTTDRSAMAVAARENASSDKSIAEMDDLLHSIAKNTRISESRAMAQVLHKSALTSLNKKYKVRDLGVKEAPFYVLIGTNVPSALVEIGFLSNSREAKRLGQEAYLELVAEGLYQGLASYVEGF